MEEYNPLASLLRFLSLTNSVTRSPGVYQEDGEYIQTAGFRTSLSSSVCTLPQMCVFTYLHCNTAAAFCQRKTKASQETSEMGILSKFSSLCQSATLPFIIWLCLFPSSLPTVYRYSVLNIKEEAKMKKNHCKLDHSNSLKTWPVLKIFFPPGLTNMDTNFTGKVIKA